MKLFKGFKEKVNRWLERMAKENEKNFGKGKLDCCQLNRQNKKIGNIANNK